jgi:DNA-binding transcriptional MerR regulator
MKISPAPLWEPADVAREVGVTTDTIKRHSDRGTLATAFRTRRGSRLFRPEDVARYIRERARRA